MEAVKQGSACLGIVGKDGVVLAALKRQPNELSGYQKKLLKIDDHMTIAVAGLNADARTLAKLMRTECLNHRYVYGAPLQGSHLVLDIADRYQRCTQMYVRRPRAPATKSPSRREAKPGSADTRGIEGGSRPRRGVPRGYSEGWIVAPPVEGGSRPRRGVPRGYSEGCGSWRRRRGRVAAPPRGAASADFCGVGLRLLPSFQRWARPRVVSQVRRRPARRLRRRDRPAPLRDVPVRELQRVRRRRDRRARAVGEDVRATALKSFLFRPPRPRRG